MVAFGVMAIVSLAAGVLLEYAGWALLAVSTAPLLIALDGLSHHFALRVRLR